MSIKINKLYLNTLQSDLKYFGDWVNNIPELNKIFKNNNPFPHVIIENFLNNQIKFQVPDSFDYQLARSLFLQNNSFEL